MPKLLVEFLQEQQEPFALKAYLLERRCSCSRGTNLIPTYSCNVDSRRYVVPNCSYLLKAVFSQFFMAKTQQKLNSSGNAGAITENSESRQENAAEDHSSISASTTSMLNSCSESDEEQYSIKKSQGESSNNSISQCRVKQPMHYSFRGLQEHVETNSCDQYMINKKALQQRNQLLIDCVREVMEKHKKSKKRREEVNKIFEAEELWELVCDNVWIWSQGINECKINHLLHIDCLDSGDEWNADFKQQKMEVSMEIESSILEDVINEIVTLWIDIG